MLLSAFGGFWDYWQLYHKVTFDGVARTITVNPGESEISVKTDIYSNWKEWVQTHDYSKFAPALRITGGDPVGGGEYTGDVYFLINNWRIIVDHSCVFDGVIYSDNFPSPFVPITGTQIVTNKVSALVNTVSTGGAGGAAPTVQEIRTEMDDNSTKLSSINSKVQTLNNAPTAVQNRQEMDVNSTRLIAIDAKVQTLSNGPSAVDIADQVRVELTPELAHLMTLENTSLTPTQATMILSMYELLGLDPTKPLVVTNTHRTAGSIAQTIVSTTDSTTVTRI